MTAIPMKPQDSVKYELQSISILGEHKDGTEQTQDRYCYLASFGASVQPFSTNEPVEVGHKIELWEHRNHLSVGMRRRFKVTSIMHSQAVDLADKKKMSSAGTFIEVVRDTEF